MKAKKKKDPNDYPLLAVRMPEEVKDEIMTEVKKIQESLNEPIKKEGKKVKLFRMNDIIIEALRKGLKQMKPREGK